ncbi:MAG TPA: hypothetical protein VF772_23655, partial [Terriglobales bacterium]
MKSLAAGNGSRIDLGPAASVEDINEAGFVVGSVRDQSGASCAAICNTSKSNSSFTELRFPPGRFSGSVGDAVNNGGDVVGSWWLLRLHIQRRDQHGPEYAIPANLGWDLSEATD